MAEGRQLGILYYDLPPKGTLFVVPNVYLPEAYAKLASSYYGGFCPHVCPSSSFAFCC